jgi:hypothetical protein
MAYPLLDTAKPDWATQTGTQLAKSIRDNMLVMRDYVASMGMLPGWDYSVSGGTAEQPAILYLKNGVEWVQITLTWGTTGGSNGNVTKAVYKYSANSGGAYDNMADSAGKYVLNLTYDAVGNVTATTWGSTP